MLRSLFAIENPMRIPLSFAVTTLAIVCSMSASAEKIDYDNQEKWTPPPAIAQSPVDIRSDMAIEGDPEESQEIVLRNTEAALKVVDNGHAVEVETNGPNARIRGRHFELAQFHFHAMSEHTFNGQSFPMEGHFVFKAKNGRLAVIGVMYREGEPNRLAGEVLDALEGAHGGEIEREDIAVMLPANRSYHHYLGSLTTPPLTENVEWYLMDTPVTLSKAQIASFNARYSHNNRKIQPLNGRPLVRYVQQ